MCYFFSFNCINNFGYNLCEMIKSLQFIRWNIYEKCFANVFTLNREYKSVYDIVKQMFLVSTKLGGVVRSIKW